MNYLHVASPSGEQSQYEEQQVRSMWIKGLLHEGTLYWREGMAEWRPLNELFPARTVSPTPSTHSSQPPQSLGKKLLLFTGIGCGGIVTLFFVAIVIAAIISPNPAPIGTEHSNSSSPAISTRQLEEEFAAVFQAAANQKMQEIFNAIHPIGTAKRVVVHDVTITDWKRGQVTNRAEDIVQLTIRYTLYWQGPITTDGYTKIVHTFDVETERYTNCQILATNGATNGDVAETLGYIGGALLYEALSD